MKLTLNKLFPNIDFIFFDEIDSTNNYCKSLAEKCFYRTTVVISNCQTAGRGTKGRNYYSPKGTGLWFSILFKPSIPLKDLSFLTLLTSLALNDTFKSYRINTSIKWPNDILLEGKKLSGILIESKVDNNNLEYVIIGIGINVNLKEEDFNDELKEKATSLKIVTGKEYDRFELLKSFIFNFELYYKKLLDNNKIFILNKYKANSFVLNKKVNLQYKNLSKTVIPIDVLEDGTLLVKDENNNIEKIVSGEISLRLLL